MIEYIIIGTLAYALLRSRKGVSGIGSPRRVFGGNSGYVNYSKSKRAVQAEEEGKRSISNFDREFVDNVNALLAIVGAEPITITKAKDIARHCKPDEWHHTSMYGNQTNYYSPETVAKAAMNESQQRAYEEYIYQIEEEKRKEKERFLNEQRLLYEPIKRRKELLEKAIRYILSNREEVEPYSYNDGWEVHNGYSIQLDGVRILTDEYLEIKSRMFGGRKGQEKAEAGLRAKRYIQDLLAEAEQMVDEQLNNE